VSELQAHEQHTSNRIEDSNVDYHSLGPSIGVQEIVIERQFNAPRTLMFQVFTQPEHLKRWWAPPPYTLPVCTIDLRPGGIWHYWHAFARGQDSGRVVPDATRSQVDSTDGKGIGWWRPPALEMLWLGEYLKHQRAGSVELPFYDYFLYPNGGTQRVGNQTLLSSIRCLYVLVGLQFRT